MRFSLALSSGLIAALLMSAPASAAVVGDAAVCASGRPALMVRVAGLKVAAGDVRLTLFREAGWLKKGGSLHKVRVPASATTMDVCVAVPGPGTYAIAIHHDVDGDRNRDRSDGAGFSRNPKLSLLGRPTFAGSKVAVGSGVEPITVRMMYLRGLTIGPARGA